VSTIRANSWKQVNGEPIQTVVQVKHKLFTDTFSSSASQTLRIPITNFYVDITPLYSTSKILVIAHCAVGFSTTPEWSWFVDRTITGGSAVQVGTIGNGVYASNRMNGYHGGPRDGNATNRLREVECFSHVVMDAPATTTSCRYQVCFQDRWVNYTTKYINRSDEDSNNGYQTRGSSSITVMEITQ
jgi:hypothetical protein